MIHRGENMEQDFIVGLYQSVGMPVGAEFSSEDVSLLYCKVFHVPSNTSEAQTAMKKIAGGDNSWSCVGGNIVDVLLEMEREREMKEQLYWDLQLLSAGNPNNLFVMDKPVNTDPHDLNRLHQSTNSNTFVTVNNQSDLGLSQSRITNTDSLQMGKKELHGSVKRLKKATRKCWAGLASEGVHSILPSPWQGKRLGVKVQAWGCVSLSDVLLLVEVKYDVVTHLLYTEMLQDYHTPRVWEALAPWQQLKEHEELEDLAEEVLVSGDMLRLAELPGAFRIYRACLGASFRNSPESREQSWSAVSLLCELHTSRQQERDTLTVLGKRLDVDSMRLLCPHIRLATLRAQREKMSYTALLAARQSWETWPHVNNPCRVEQADLWLQREEEEQNELISGSLRQYSVLQLLVLSQEQERKHLVKLIHEVSLEDLQGAACTIPPKEESNKKDALKNVCIKRLRQIHASLQTHKTQTPLEQANLHIQVQSEAQPQIQPHMSNNTAMWSQHQLDDYALLLLTHLLELQEVQATALLPELMDMSVQHLQVLQAKYDSELQAQCYTNLLQILMPDGPPLTSGSKLSPCPNLIDNSSDEQITTQSCCTGPAEPQNRSDGPTEALTSNSVTLQAADGTNKRDVCTGCGAAMEELPYLEILCVSNATSNTHQSIAIEKRAQEEEDGSTTTSAQSYEKQGSLITLAWSKPPDADTDNDAESAGVGTGQSLDSESSMHTRVRSGDMGSTAGDTQCDETSGESHDEECGSTGHRDVQSADQQCSTETQLTLEDRSVVNQPQRVEDMSEHNLQTQTLQAALPHPSVDPPEIKPHTDHICSGLSSETSDISRVGVETCSTVIQSEQWDLMGPDASDAEDQKYNSQINADCEIAERVALRESMLMETEQVREPVSAIERERTMRSLVDMQKKVEQRQQRDRERQLLRVQERLSIIQNRKAEEDLLGLKHTDRLKHLTQDLPQEDKNQQKTVVRERLEQLRRERSYVMQSKRDRNTAGFKELLGPLTLHSREIEDGTD